MKVDEQIMVGSEASFLKYDTPQSFTITFHDNSSKVVGELILKDGKASFEGNADESAMVFFNAMRNALDEAIKEQAKILNALRT